MMNHHDAHGSHPSHDETADPQHGATHPGGGREERLPGADPVVPDPSNPADPVDGAPSPGPQPGATDPSRPAADAPSDPA